MIARASQIWKYYGIFGCMPNTWHMSTKLHFANSWVFRPLSVYVRDAFIISTWSLSSELCFQVLNSRHSLLFCWRLSNSVALLRVPLLDWGWIAWIRHKASCTELNCRTVTVRYEYMYRANPSVCVCFWLEIDIRVKMRTPSTVDFLHCWKLRARANICAYINDHFDSL